MISVGFDMYCHMLGEAVRELRGQETEDEKTLPPVELPVEAYIPEDYIPTESMRIATYRKMASQFTEEDVSRLEEELDDRFGPPPAPVRNALGVLRLRIDPGAHQRADGAGRRHRSGGAEATAEGFPGTLVGTGPGAP